MEEDELRPFATPIPPCGTLSALSDGLIGAVLSHVPLLTRHRVARSAVSFTKILHLPVVWREVDLTGCENVTDSALERIFHPLSQRSADAAQSIRVVRLVGCEALTTAMPALSIAAQIEKLDLTGCIGISRSKLDAMQARRERCVIEPPGMAALPTSGLPTLLQLHPGISEPLLFMLKYATILAGRSGC